MLIWLIVAIIVIAAVIVKIKRSSRFIFMRIGEQEPITPRKTSGEIEHMSGCALCGLYIPDSEAVEWRGKTFCCKEHAQQYTNS